MVRSEIFQWILNRNNDVIKKSVLISNAPNDELINVISTNRLRLTSPPQIFEVLKWDTV
jgi:hypothetical protein